MNASALDYLNQELNKQANVLDYLITFSTDLMINTAENIKLQASTLAKLTESTNQLTRKTSVIHRDFLVQFLRNSFLLSLNTDACID